MYVFYWFFSKVGIVFSGSGRSRLSSALSAFTKAQDELQTAIKHEKKTIKKADDNLEKARKEFEKKKKELEKKSNEHDHLRAQSEAYLKKIDNFLSIDDDDVLDTPDDDTTEKPLDMSGTSDNAQEENDEPSVPDNERTTYCG